MIDIKKCSKLKPNTNISFLELNKFLVGKDFYLLRDENDLMVGELNYMYVGEQFMEQKEVTILVIKCNNGESILEYDNITINKVEVETVAMK